MDLDYLKRQLADKAMQARNAAQVIFDVLEIKKTTPKHEKTCELLITRLLVSSAVSRMNDAQLKTYVQDQYAECSAVKPARHEKPRKARWAVSSVTSGTGYYPVGNADMGSAARALFVLRCSFLTEGMSKQR